MHSILEPIAVRAPSIRVTRNVQQKSTGSLFSTTISVPASTIFAQVPASTSNIIGAPTTSSSTRNLNHVQTPPIFGTAQTSSFGEYGTPIVTMTPNIFVNTPVSSSSALNTTATLSPTLITFTFSPSSVNSTSSPFSSTDRKQV